LERLIHTVRDRPVEGFGHNGSGNRIRVRIDEEFLLNYLLGNATGNFINTGELLAAASSLENGDSAPLLRLGAESFFPQAADFGDPTVFSAGAAAATGCADLHQPWAWAAPVKERERQYGEAVAALPSDYFEPFLKSAVTNLPFNLFGKGCLWGKNRFPPRLSWGRMRSIPTYQHSYSTETWTSSCRLKKPLEWQNYFRPVAS
jgi:hypothetical protein